MSDKILKYKDEICRCCRHCTIDAYVMIGLIITVYIQWPTVGLRPHFTSIILLHAQRALIGHDISKRTKFTCNLLLIKIGLKNTKFSRHKTYDG